MKHNKSNAEDLFSAMKEKKITVNVLANEIKTVLDDFFVCCSVSEGGKIKATFLNGQEFEIRIKEKIFRLRSK